jgi:hypothetical protein
MLSPPLYARPEIIRDSSAPRRQLDGGVPPAADGRGGGQTRPWRRGCPRRPCCRAVLVVARPDGVCPEERPAGIGRSGVVAVVDPASRHATASVAGVQQAASTHPVSASGIRLSSRPVSGHLGVVVQRSGGRTAAVQLSGVQLSGVHPCGVQPSGVCPCRSACVRLLPLRRWPGGARSRWPPGRVEALWLPGRRRLDRRSRRPRRGRCCRSRVGQGGPVATRAAGLGAGRGGRAYPPSDQAGQAGVRGARRGRLRGGHEGQAAARGGGSRRVAAALGLGARPRWVVVAEADGRVGGPGGARRGADGDGCAAPSRPKPAASAPSSLPAAL